MDREARENIRCTFEGRPFLTFVFGDAPGLVFPAVDLRAGESVDGLDGRPLAPEGPARTADLVAIVLRAGARDTRDTRLYSGVCGRAKA